MGKNYEAQKELMTPLYWLGWRFSQLCWRVLFNWKVEGEERVPKEGCVIIAPNHSSAIDPFVVGAAVQRPLFFMGKEELFQNWLIAALVRGLHVFPVRRGRPDLRALRHALKLLRAGKAVLVFPEGTRNPDFPLKTAELGVALLAVRTESPIVPVAVMGTEKILPAGSLRPRRGNIFVRFGEPMWFTADGGASEREKLRAIANEVMRALSSLSGRPYQLIQAEKVKSR